MTTMLYVVLGLLALVLFLSLIAPKTYDVSRTVEIARPKQEVFDYIRSLKKMNEWSPWAKKDPNMVQSFSGVDGEPGCISHWVGNKEVGEGEQEIKKVINGERIDSELRFLKPFKSTSDCYMITEDVGNDSTKVTWGFSGNSKFPMNIISLFKSMDSMVGKDFEEGMQRLKTNLEG